MNTNHTIPKGSFEACIRQIDAVFSVPDNFGIIRQTSEIGGLQAVLYAADGLCDMGSAQRVLAFCKEFADGRTQSADSFSRSLLSYGETSVTSDAEQLFTGVATGCMALFCEAFPGEGILIKCRNIPERALAEPEHDKVLRGAHVGFGETIVRSCAMLRRQLPTSSLVMHPHLIGKTTKTAVVVCFLRGKADPAYLSFVESKLRALDPETLCLSMQSLAECLLPGRSWNPFPRFRYTERPDAAAASLAEGSVLIFCDGSPQAMILPVSLFSFLEETNDFYLAPFTGTYLRLLRLFTFFMSVYLIPVWYALVKFPFSDDFASFFAFAEETAVPLLLQILIIELAVDGLKMASMNTPSALSNSLSVIGGLILGEFAIEVGWFQPESILYMAVVAIANFTQHNYELGYAFKYVRITMLLLTSVLGWPGILLGTLLLLFLLLSNPTLEEKRRFFYPLIPFDGKALCRLLFRVGKSPRS